jgi:hypothetical protein
MSDNNQTRRRLFIDSEDEIYDDQGKRSMLGVSMGITLFMLVLLAVMTTCTVSVP